MMYVPASSLFAIARHAHGRVNFCFGRCLSYTATEMVMETNKNDCVQPKTALLAFALTRECLRSLDRQFKYRLPHRSYLGPLHAHRRTIDLVPSRLSNDEIETYFDAHDATTLVSLTAFCGIFRPQSSPIRRDSIGRDTVPFLIHHLIPLLIQNSKSSRFRADRTQLHQARRPISRFDRR